MKKILSPRVCLILAMLCFGTIGYFVDKIPLKSGEIALYRAVSAVLLIGLYMLFTKQKISSDISKKDLLLLFLSGVLIGINWILLFEAYNYTTVSVATLSYYFAPVIVTVGAAILFGEKMSLKRWICVGGSAVGLAILTGLGDTANSNQHIKGIAFGLCAAVFYASVVLLNKYIKGADGIQRTFLQFSSATAVLLPYVLLTGGINIGTLAPTEIASMLTVGFLHTGIAYCLYFTAIKKIPGQQVSVLSYIDPLVAVIVSVSFMSELLSVLHIIGGVLILGFTLLNEIKITPKSR